MNKLLLACTFSLAAIASSTHAAGLEGDQVHVNLTIGGFPSFLCSNCDADFTVMSGPEGAIFNNTQAIDFGANSFSITSNNNYTQFGFNPAPADRAVTLRLSSLDFGAPLTGVNYTTTLNGPVNVTFGADFAQFSFFDQPIPKNTYITAQFVTAPVPEPETYALMLAGLAAVGAIVRRRRKGDHRPAANSQRASD